MSPLNNHYSRTKLFQTSAALLVSGPAINRGLRNLRASESCEPASHASHRASHASHASHAIHSANVKNFYLFYLHSREKILDEFFSLFVFFRFCYNF